MKRPTPTPWQVTHADPSVIADCDGETRGCSRIATTHGTRGEKRRNAAFIVRAVNAHHDLVHIAQILIFVEDQAKASLAGEKMADQDIWDFFARMLADATAKARTCLEHIRGEPT